MKKFCQKLTNLSENTWFSEIYIFILALVTFLGWFYGNIPGMIILIVIASLVLLFFGDLTYITPIGVFFIFTLKEGFPNNEIPISLIVVASIFIFILFIFVIKSGFKLRKMKSFYGLLGLALMNLIPIFWCNTVEKGYEVFYFFFFANLGYLIIYLLFVNGIKNASLKFLAITMSYLAIILVVECGVMVYSLRESYDSIFKMTYFLGWGVCNEAGIMLCVATPFIYYLIASANKIPYLIFNFLKLIIAILGVLLTTSRGSYLTMGLIIFILTFLLLFVTKRRRFMLYFATIFCILLIGLVIAFSKEAVAFINKILDEVFMAGLDDNGRKEIWDKGINLYKTNSLYKWFGAGICAIIEERMSAAGYQSVPLVFHSTFVQTLVMGGIFGLVMLLVHFFEKYRNLFKTEKRFFLFVFVSYLCVDLYGMIDNTYHMYYYMIPLVIVLATIDVHIYNSKNENNIK